MVVLDPGLTDDLIEFQCSEASVSHPAFAGEGVDAATAKLRAHARPRGVRRSLGREAAIHHSEGATYVIRQLKAVGRRHLAGG